MLDFSSLISWLFSIIFLIGDVIWGSKVKRTVKRTVKKLHLLSVFRYFIICTLVSPRFLLSEQAKGSHVVMFVLVKLNPKSPNLDFDTDFDLPSFALHFCLVFNLWGSFVTSCLFSFTFTSFCGIRTIFIDSFQWASTYFGSCEWVSLLLLFSLILVFSRHCFDSTYLKHIK